MSSHKPKGYKQGDAVSRVPAPGGKGVLVHRNGQAWDKVMEEHNANVAKTWADEQATYEKSERLRNR